MQLLHRILSSLDESTKLVMQEVMQDWEQRRRGGSHEIGGGGTGADLGVTIPLGPGEWDEALGLPLCVACHNVSISSIGMISWSLETDNFRPTGLTH